MLDSEIIGKFKEFQEKRGEYSDLKIEDVEFEIKRISSKNPNDLICKKRMGFTPKRDKNGDIYWFTVNDLNNNNDLIIDIPQTKEKTTIKLIKEAVDKNNTGKSEKLLSIQKGDVLVSFKLTVGVVKIYNSNEPAYCNEAIDILEIKEGYFNKYIAYNCMIEYPLYGTKTNNGITLNENDKEKIKIYIPKDLNETYTSHKLQEIIVEFLEWGFVEADKIKENIDKRADILQRAKKCLIPSVFKKDYVKRTFGKYAKENGLDYNITDVEFEDKFIYEITNSISSSSGYTKNYYKNNKGKYPLYTGALNVVAYVKPKSDSDVIDIESVSYNKDNDAGSKAFYHNEPYIMGGHHYAFVAKDEYKNKFFMRYFYFCLSDIFIKNRFYQSKQPIANIGLIKQFKIKIPKPLKNYTSLDIQKHIADFIDHYMNIIDREEDRVSKAYDAVERLKKVYLNRTFRLINWEENNE